MRLQRLNRAARRIITPEFVRGDDGHSVVETEAWEPYAEEADISLPLGDFLRSARAIMADSLPFATTIDGRAAVEFHRTLRLSRRQASDPGIWRFLAVVVVPEFIRHRWQNPTFTAGRSRFWSMGTRPDSNAIARLWWIAELTRDGDDYALTTRVLRSQSVANAIFIRSFCEHRPAVEACAEVFDRLVPDDIERAARGLHHELSTRVLPTLSKADVEALLLGQ